MKAVLIAPRKYVQGRGVLAEAGTYVRLLGKKPLVLWDACVRQLVGATLLTSLKEAGLEAVEVLFEGESSKAEAARIARSSGRPGPTSSIGVGGGKTLDTGKAVAVASGAKMVTCPTIASNDSPTSAATVWYDADGNCCGWDCWPFNPDLVLVDSQVIANGPVRAFVAGMGDALSTWVEAEAAYKSRAATLAGGVPTMAAMALARLCYDTLDGARRRGQAGAGAARPDPRRGEVHRGQRAAVRPGLRERRTGHRPHDRQQPARPSPSASDSCTARRSASASSASSAWTTRRRTDEIHAIVDFEIAVGLPVTFADLSLEGRFAGAAAADRRRLCGEGLAVREPSLRR